MTHWYCISLSDLITFICNLTSPILGDFYRSGCQPETKQQKVAYLNYSHKIAPVNLEKSEMQHK